MYEFSFNTFLTSLTPKFRIMKKNLLAFCIVLISVSAFSQSRYLDEVFTNVSITQNVEYGKNFSFITGHPDTANLVMDVYEPQGDWITERPLVIYLHTGSFLPILINGTTTGDMHDSATVEMCKQFARRGYIAVSMDYRVGWNPLATGTTGQDIRTGTLLQAVYRSLQDTKTCVRYFKMTAHTQGNPWRIDTNKITLCGQGSGGYVALAYATLKDLNQIVLPKFIATNNVPGYGIFAGLPYVIGDIWGDLDGFGGVDTLNIPNWPGYTSNVCFIVNMGGALGDSTWLQAGDAPMVCFHSINDPFAPYSYGPVIVPTTGQFVVDVSGSYDIVRIADALGNNSSFNLPFNDPYTTRANMVNDGRYGLFPFVLPGNPNAGGIGQAGPWEWWNLTALENLSIALNLGAAYADATNANSLITNPDMSKAKALAYIDSIQGYLAPRLVASCNLDTMHINIGVPQINLGNEMKMFPVPAQTYFTLQLENSAEQMQFLRIYDLTGKPVMEISNINSSSVKISRENLSTGLYMVKIGLKDRELNGKMMFE